MTRPHAAADRALDLTARRRAQTEFRLPLLLEAGAGTGKTTTLVGRVLAWALGPGWETATAELSVAAARYGGPPPTQARVAGAVLEGIVAITFTDAAASEMERRIGLGLARLVAGELPTGLLEEALPSEPAVRAHRASALCDTLDHLRVSTIHSFCLWLISRHPFELGLAPRVTVDSEQRLLPDLAHEVVEEWLRAVARRPLHPHEGRLALRGIGPGDLHGALVELATGGTTHAALVDDPLDPRRVEALRARLSQATTALLELVEPALTGRKGAGGAFKIPGSLADLLHALERVDPSHGVDGLIAAVAGSFPDLKSGGGLLLRKWERSDFTATETPLLAGVAALPARAGRLRALLWHVAALDPELLDAARRTLVPMLEQVHQRLRAAGVESYQALLLHAHALLRDDPQVRSQVRSGIRQLLVDEFQDTDDLQCEIVRLLALDDDSGPRPGLFLVGDPKQSIYGWRSADLRAYDGFRDLVVRHGGHVDPLVVNFRSAPALLDEVDRAVAPVLLPAHGLQPEYRALVASEATTRQRPGRTLQGAAPAPHDARVAYWVTWPRDDDGTLDPAPLAVAATAAEAKAIAADLAARHRLAQAAGGADSFRYEECALLLRSMSDLDEYLAALRDADVPFAVERDRSYYRRREIIDATALVTAVLDPADQLALVALLRSPMVGVPDAALLPLWAGGLPDRVAELTDVDVAALEQLRALLQRVADQLPPTVPGLDRIRGWEQSGFVALHSLGVLRASFAADPPDLFLERMRQTFQQEVLEAARYLGSYRVANLDRFFRALSSAMDESGNDPQAILRALREGVAQETQAEEARPPAAARGAVRVMTIHKAKGLEFDHVYLPQIHKEGRARSERATQAQAVDGGHEYVLLGARTLGYDLVEQRAREVEAAERVRTLYVAMTRARERLVVIGRWPQAAEPERALHGATYAELLQARRPAPPLSELATTGAHLLDAVGVAWRTIGDDLPAPAVSEAVESATSAMEPGEASLRLHGCRAAAGTRMARPHSEALSHAAHEALVEVLRGEESAGIAGDGTDPEALQGPPAPAALLRRATAHHPPRDARAQRIAVTVGTMIHRVLEESAGITELESLRPRLPGMAGTLLGEDPDECAAAVDAAATLLGRVAKGRLWARLRGLAPAVLARELPVLVPPAEPATAPSGHAAAVAFRSGVIDLVYQDPDDSALVVADYKTDAIADPDALRARVAVYRPQIVAYAGALQQALDLPSPPRAELWFLAVDEIVRVELSAAPNAAGPR